MALLLRSLPSIGFVELPVRAAHAVRVVRLPDVHRDPFDRLLVAQSLTKPLTLVTNDGLLGRYSKDIRVVS